MKILIGSSSLPPGAGIATYVHNIADWFSHQGHDVLVCVSPPEKRKHNFASEYKVKCVSAPTNIAGENEALDEVYEITDKYKPDAIINNDNIYIANILPFLPSEVRKVSVVHGFRESLFSWDEHKVIYNASLVNHDYLDYIVAISTPMRNKIVRQLKLTKKKVKLIYNGVNKLQENSNLKRNLTNNATIIFAGGRSFAKGADTMALASILLARRAKNYRIVWAGSVGTQLSIIQKIIKELPNITFVGRLPHSELMEKMQEGDVLVMPSRAEGCPMLMLEAMSNGMAIVASDCKSAMKEIVEQSNSGAVVSVGSAIQVAKSLSTLVHNRNVLRKFKNNSYRYFENNLTLDHCGSSLLRLVERKSSNAKQTNAIYPPNSFYPYHRKTYQKGKFSLSGLIQRFNLACGRMPSRVLY